MISGEAQRQKEIKSRGHYAGDVHSERDDFYIRAPFEPWQLKSKMAISDTEEIKFDDDDEDALVLQQQPFETVMSTS